MATAYNTATDRVVLRDDEPMGDRTFKLILINPNIVKFDAEHTDLASVLAEDVADAEQKAERVALRTQVIKNPNLAVNIGSMILQFFAVNPNQDSLVTQSRAGVLVEEIDGAETPLFYLNKDEVWSIAHGEGFATALYLEALAQ